MAAQTQPLISGITEDDGRLDNPRAYAADESEPLVSVRPLRLHSQTVEGPLGGHCFSSDFARYLASVKPRLVVGWQLRIRYWWASAYGRARVQRAFTRQMGSARGETAYRVALVLCSGCWGADCYDRLMAETGHTASWLSHIAHQAIRLADAAAA